MDKRILHISPKSIFPKIDGGCVAMHDMLKMLSDKNHVKHVCISTPKHPFKKNEYPSDLIEKTAPESIYIDTSFQITSFISSFFKGENYHVNRFFSKAAEVFFTNILSLQTYDFIFLESIFLTPYLNLFRKLSSAKIIIRTHNVEHLIWQRLAFSSNTAFKKIGYQFIAKQLKNYELEIINKVDGLCCVTDADSLFFNEQNIITAIQTIPVSIEVTENKVDYQNNNFFFIGAMNWVPNTEAVNILLKDIFPKLQELKPETKLHIAGSYMSSDLSKTQIKGITIHGKVPDVNKFMLHHGIMLVPMLSGSGVRIKILEALALGVPVISTEIGFLGINVKHGVHVLKAENWEDFLDLALKLHSDEALRRKLGENAQKFIAEEYNFKRINEKLETFIHGI